MKFLLKILSISFLAFGLQFILPWWAIAIPAFVIALFGGGAFTNFLAGFFGNGLAWFIYAAYLDYQTQSILSKKVVLLFYDSIKTSEPLHLLILTASVAGLVGAMSALSGTYLNKIFVQKQDNYYRK